jgi:hypothetical protein
MAVQSSDSTVLLVGLLIMMVPAILTVVLSLGYALGRRLGRRAGQRAVMSFAVVLAGKRRSHLREEWRAHLDGRTAWQRRGDVGGFLLAAVRMRLRDLARPVWRPVDWVLATEDRTNAFIALPVALLALYICATEGVHAFIAEKWLGCPALAGVLYVFTRWLRRVRGIEIADRQRQSQ